MPALFGMKPPMDELRSRLLLVTTRNLSAPTGEWRLIANRSAALRSEFKIRTDVLYLRPDTCTPALLKGSCWSEDVRAIRFSNRVDSQLCFALLELRRSISSWLKSNASGYVVISGGQLYLAPLGIPRERLIIDLHGTLREWVEGNGRTLRDRMLRFGYPLAALAEKRALEGAFGALVVSTALAAYARACGVHNVWRIPCGLPRNSVIAESGCAREEWRKRLSIPADTTAFVYSGGLSKWQCVKEAVQLFGRVRRAWPGNCQLVIMTPRIEALSAIVAGLDTSGITACSVGAEDIGAALCACDIGLLLRDDNSTNHNAFPNKFAEYIAAGLFVITSPGLKDSSEFVLKHRVGVLIDPREIRDGLEPERVGFLVDAYHGRGSHQQYLARAKAAALDELTMEHLVEPFAKSVVSK